MPKKLAFILLLIICIFTLLPFIGITNFHTKGEPREAIVAYSMLEKDNWILPTNNGGDIAYKPPFFHWCIATISTIAGEVNECTSRLPSAIFLIIMVLTGFLLYAKRKGVEVALIASLITLTTFEIHRAGMNCRVDMVQTAFIVLSLYQLFLWCEKKEKKFPIYATLFMGVATLTKGPVGIILPCLTTGTFLLIRGTTFSKAFTSLFVIAIVSCILPGIWYFFAWKQGGGEFINLIIEENFGRFMGKMSYESHENPISYNFISIIAGFAPWTLLVIFSLFGLKYHKLKKIKITGRYIKEQILAIDPIRLFSLLSILIIFTFYCIPKSKRSVYLLPIYPFIAYFLAEYFIYLTKQFPKVIKTFGYTLICISILVVCTFIVIKLNLFPLQLISGKHVVENLSYIQALKNIPLNICNISLILLPIIPIIFFFYLRERKLDRLYSIIAIIMTLQISLDGLYQPAILNEKSDKKIALQIKEITSGAKLYSYVEINQMRFFIINFYNNDQVIPIENGIGNEGYLLVGKDDFNTFSSNHPELLFTKILESHKRGGDVKQIITLYKFKKNTRITHKNFFSAEEM